jgi:hypothetical protein
MIRIPIKEEDVRMIEYDDESIVLRIKGVKNTDYTTFKSQISQDYEVVNQATKILINHCGETGKNERLIETLQRLSGTVNRLNDSIQRCKRNEGSKQFIDFLSSELQKIRDGK